MKIPKYVQEAIQKRAYYAEKYMEMDSLVSKWIDQHGIDCEYTHLHTETISNPWAAAEETINDIRNMSQTGMH